MRCELVTWDDFLGLVRRLALQVRDSGFRPDLIIAIARGGYMPARLISDYLDIPDLASLRVIHYRGAEQEVEARIQDSLSVMPDGQRILLVDDVSDSGETFEVAIRVLSRILGRSNELSPSGAIIPPGPMRKTAPMLASNSCFDPSSTCARVQYQPRSPVRTGTI